MSFWYCNYWICRLAPDFKIIEVDELVRVLCFYSLRAAIIVSSVSFSISIDFIDKQVPPPTIGEFPFLSSIYPGKYDQKNLNLLGLKLKIS